jgi:hypothetical protein
MRTVQKYEDKEFRKLFLLEFTREMIRHSAGAEVLRLKKILEEEQKEPGKDLRRFVKQKIIPAKIKREIGKGKESGKFEKSITSSLQEVAEPLPLIKKIPERIPVLRIPEPALPPALQYLRPTPSEKFIELDKLNPLIADPLVRIVECDGPDKNIIVKGSMGVKKTGIILSKEEIKKVVNTFSEVTKIPMNEGIFKVAFGQLILTAIISEMVGTKFIIKKMPFVKI